MKKISILLLAVFSLLFVAIQVPQAYSAPIVGNVDLNVEVFKGEGPGGKVTGHGLSQYAYGSRVSISLTGLKQTQEKEFGFYLYKGQLIEDEEAEFLVTDSSKITVVLKDSTEVVAAFVDTNGALLDLKYGVGTFTPTAPTEVLDRPGFEFSGFGTVSSISEDTVFVAQYTRTNTTDISVTVTDGALVTGVTYNDVVTLEPIDAVNFKYWADKDGQFVSSKPDYTFTALEDVEFVAVSEGVVPTAPSVYLSNVSGIRAGYQSFLGYVEYDETYELLEYGVLVSDETKVLELGDLDVEKKPSTVLSPINEFLRSFVEGTYSSFRAYAILKQGTEQVVVYSDNNFVATTEDATFGFEDASKTSYASADVISDSLTWNLSDALIGNLENDKKIDTKSIRIQNSGVVELKTPIKGITNISFSHAKFGSDANSSLKLEIKINTGVWVEVDTNISVSSTTLTEYSVNLSVYNISANDDVYFRLTKSGGNRINVDNIVLSTALDSKVYQMVLVNEDVVTKSSLLVNTLFDEPTDPVKTGYSFVGWFNESNEEFIFTTPIKRHTTLTAVFEINEYTLTFDTDGGTLVAPITGDYATAVSAPAAPTKDGYTFAGWSPALPETMPAGNQTYTATWEAIDYTITFDVDGGSVVAPLTQAFGSELVMPANPTKDGFNFMDWFTDVERTLPFEATTMPLGNITLYALWQDASLSSTVTFETNGGSDISPVVVNNGEAVLEPVDPTKDGYTFIGWYTDVALELAYDFESLISTDFTLYAKWEQNVYTISFDPNGGSGLVQNKSAVHGFALVEAERPTQPTRAGHNFVGWFDTSSETGGNQWAVGTVFTSVKTYYARWTSSTTTATIDTSGSYGSNISDGLIPTERLSIANPGSASIGVSFQKNNSSTTSIFNNSSGEIRLYGGSGNGGQLTISVGNGYKITQVTVATSQNNGLSINGSASNTAATINVNIEGDLSEITLKNVAGSTSQVRITLITIVYSQS